MVKHAHRRAELLNGAQSVPNNLHRREEINVHPGIQEELPVRLLELRPSRFIFSPSPLALFAFTQVLLAIGINLVAVCIGHFDLE